MLLCNIVPDTGARSSESLGVVEAVAVSVFVCACVCVWAEAISAKLTHWGDIGVMSAQT